MISIFTWRVLGLFSFLFLAYTISVITVTLLLVDEIHQDNDIDSRKVTYVQVANWIYVGFLGLTVLTILIAAPYLRKYLVSKNTLDPKLTLGLKPAKR